MVSLIYRSINAIVISIILLVAILVCRRMPQVKYKGSDIISRLHVPYSIRGWRSKDVKGELNLEEDDRYNFIGDVFARHYFNDYGDDLLFILIDAGNFHHPRVCFRSSGFQIKNLDDTELAISGKRVMAKTLLATRGKQDNFVILYWIVINKKLVNWTGQKIQDLIFSLLNKDKIGIMGRLDIPIADANDIGYARLLAYSFIRDISRGLSKEERAYIFGVSP